MPYSSPLPISTSPPPPLRSPSSPKTSYTSDPSETELLSDSFILVQNQNQTDEDIETESTSTVSTALLADLSDTSSEPRYEGSLGGSIHGELSETEDELELGSEVDVDVDGQVEHDLSGSYIDAEATESLMTDSRTTLSTQNDIWHSPDRIRVPIPRRQANLGTGNGTGTGSQFRFIFPDPEASFSSSATYSDGTTPGGSLANLLPPPKQAEADLAIPAHKADRFARLGVMPETKRERSPGRVDEGWLQDARTWLPTAYNVPFQERDRSVNGTAAGDGYTALGSMSDAGRDGSSETKGVQQDRDEDGDEAALLEKEGKARNKSSTFAETEQHFKQALRAMAAVGTDNLNKKWGLLAFASCALAIIGAITPAANLFHGSESSSKLSRLHNATSSRTVVYSPAREIVTLDKLLETTHALSTVSTTSDTPRSIATQIISDLQLIRDAISTFTLTPAQQQDVSVQASTAGESTDQDNGPRYRRSPGISTPCCSRSGSEVDNSLQSRVALTVPAASQVALSVFDDSGYKAWMKAMANKVIRPTVSGSPPVMNETTVCNCTPTTHIEHRYSYLLQRVQDYAISTTSAISQLYHPMMRHVDYELGEIYRLARFIRHSDYTRSVIAGLHMSSASIVRVHQAILAVAERQRLDDLAQLKQIRQYLLTTWDLVSGAILNRTLVEQAKVAAMLQSTQQGLVKVADYARYRKEEVQEESMRSLRQAKKGLNRLLDSRSDTDVPGKDGTAQAEGEMEMDIVETPTGHRFSRTGRMPRERLQGGSRRDRHGGRYAYERSDPSSRKHHRRDVDIGAPEGRMRRRWRSLLQAVHHGAVQVVLQ